ncbi:DUF5819 family protein [Streptomyces parvus]|uniref:DUF5819 family protein n=1 Tax=Streptomyces parvus TaxID=66428 RepID=UPI0021008E28|nr:DUF5819 family protein [Streptomyces parvus]MCQ1577035.1 DUF5819 family protein [Streptomyces parvus]
MVIDGERGGMDSDHDRSSAGGGKDAWPQALNRPAEARDTLDVIPPNGAVPSNTEVTTDHAPSTPSADPSVTGRGIAGLSTPYQVVAALALSLIGLLACTQVAMVFLHVAPSNTLTKEHGKTIDRWIYPEFEQNWKLFAPNPLQQNVAVHVRAEVVDADGRRTTRWMNLTHEDAKGIRGNFFPSHVHQNELRRGWDFYVNSHDSENRPNGLRGDLSERYVRRIAMLRLSERDYGGTIERIQLRSATSSIAPPPWSTEKISTRPVYRVLPWWTVTPDDLPEHAAEKSRDAARAEANQ